MQPRILYLDIETAPIIAAIWEPFEANAVWVERDTFLFCFAAKWAGDSKVQTFALPDYSRYKTHKHDDKHLVRDLRRFLDEADIVVAHNGDAFDIKKIRSRMIVHKLRPPSPFKTIDTLKIARSCKFDSNKLDNLGRYLQEGRKIPNTGAALWRGCYHGDLKAWRSMRRYNAQDVLLLERVYHRLKPWAGSNHPNLAAYGESQGCPRCLSFNIEARGFHVLRTRKTQRFNCQDCGFWFSSEATNAQAKSSAAASPHTKAKTAPVRGRGRRAGIHRPAHRR